MFTAPDGTTHILTKDWEHLTIDDLARMGVHPGDQPSWYTPHH